MKHNLLLVEDRKEIHRMIEQSVLGLGVSLDYASSILEANDYLNSKIYDLILLDIELPDGNGIDLCTQIQSSMPNTAIFFLTAHDQLAEKVLGFSAGADDYITKPFNTLELKARIEAKLRKNDLLLKTSDTLKWKELILTKSSQEVQIYDDQSSDYIAIDLTALEYKLLTYFANRVGEVIHRETILNDIWGEDIHVYPRSVDTHVSKLRKKLGHSSSIIESIHGAGYKFNPSIQ